MAHKHEKNSFFKKKGIKMCCDADYYRPSFFWRVSQL